MKKKQYQPKIANYVTSAFAALQCQMLPEEHVVKGQMSSKAKFRQQCHITNLSNVALHYLEYLSNVKGQRLYRYIAVKRTLEHC